MGRRSDHSRGEISAMALDAAGDIVSRQGLEGLTARKVAQAIGYAPGTLYVVFKNQDELILHLNARTLDQLYLELERVADTSQKPREAILSLANAYVTFSGDRANLWSAIFDHHPVEKSVPPSWYQEKVDRLYRLVELPLGQLDSHRDADEIRLAANALWSGIHGVCNLRQVGSLETVGGVSPEKIVESLVTNYLVGYAKG